MLVELRKLIFSKKGLTQAFLKECKEEGIKVPNSQVQDIKIEGENPIKVAIQFMSANPDQPIEIPLNEHFVLSSMILMCGELGVPLPRHANKVVKRQDDGLAMVITTTFK